MYKYKKSLPDGKLFLYCRDEVAEKEPAKALDLILKMSSFIMPKMRAIQSEDLGKQCDCETYRN